MIAHLRFWVMTDAYKILKLRGGLTSPLSCLSFSRAAKLATYIAGWLITVELSLSFGPEQMKPCQIFNNCTLMTSLATP